MAQSVTFTLSGGKTVTVDIDADDGKADNISDDEAKQAFERAISGGKAKREELVGGTMTVGKTSLASDRYTALAPAANGGAAVAVPPVVAPVAAAEAPKDFLFSRHQLHLAVPGTIYGLNGLEGAIGAGLGYTYNTPVSEDGKLVLGFGPGFIYQKFFGQPSPVTLTQEDKETGANGRDFTGQHLINPYVSLALKYAVTPNFLIGGLANLGVGIMPGDDVTRRPSGNDYSSSYCPPGQGGVFGDDVTGCENRPLPSYAQPGADNSSTQGGTNIFFRGIFGPTVDYKFNDRISLGGLLGLDFLAGDVSRVGGTAALNLTVGLDTPAPAKAVNPDEDGDGVLNESDKCANTPRGTKVNANGCAIDTDGDGVSDSDDKCPDVKGTKENGGCPGFEGKVTSTPETVKAEDKFLIGLNVNTQTRVRVSFKAPDGTLTNSNSLVIDEGSGKYEFKVPAELKAGKYKLVITFEDTATKVKSKPEERDIRIVENVSAADMGTFPPNTKPALKDIKLLGTDKLDVTYVIEGFDKNGKSIGSTKGGPVTLSGTMTQITFDQAPEPKGFRKDIRYVVTLSNKDGFPVLTKNFEIGENPPAPKGGGGGRPRL